MLSYRFPPVKTPGTVRLRNFYTEAKTYFETRYVLTSSNRSLMIQDEGLAADTPHLETLSTLDLRCFHLKRSGRNTLSSATKQRPEMQVLSKLSDSFPFNLLWGDGGLVYILAGYRRGKQLVEQEGITHLFSSFRPYSDHAIAWLLKRRFPKLVWIADFRDLHVNRAISNVYLPGIQHWFNRQILRQADVVTTVSQGLAHSLQRYHSRVYVLPNGIGEVPEKLPELKLPPKFTIGYTGSVYPELQDARPLLQALRLLIDEDCIDPKQMQLVVAGKDGAIWRQWVKEFGLEELLIDLGFVSRREALALQRQSHLNLLLTWSMGKDQGVLTAKLYEYLAARRPVLGVVKGHCDEELEKVFSSLDHSCLFYTATASPTLPADFLMPHYQRWQSGKTPEPALDTAALSNYSWNTTIAMFMEELGIEPEKIKYK